MAVDRPTPAADGGGGGEIDGPEAEQSHLAATLKDLGVDLTHETVDHALAIGYSLAKLAAVIQFAVDHRWFKPGMIVARLKLSPNYAPDEAWHPVPQYAAYQDCKRRRSNQAPTSTAPTLAELEARYGEQLDSLNALELRELAGDAPMRERPRLMRCIDAGDDPRRQPLHRRALLETLAAVAARERQPALATR